MAKEEEARDKVLLVGTAKAVTKEEAGEAKDFSFRVGNPRCQPKGRCMPFTRQSQFRLTIRLRDFSTSRPWCPLFSHREVARCLQQLLRERQGPEGR